jgi:sugar lactone lactonase YvrE
MRSWKMKDRDGRTGKRMTSLMRVAILAALAGLAAPAGAQSLRLTPSVTRYAGTGAGGPIGDSGGASTLPLNAPSFIAADALGNRYIADTANNCIRRVDASGNMSTIVGLVRPGGDTCNVSLNPNPSAAQGLLKPAGLAVDASGNLFIADSGHNCIRRLPAGTQGTAALVPVVDTCTNSTTNSLVPSPAGLALDLRGNLYMSVNDGVDGIYQVLAAFNGTYGSPCLVDGASSARVSNLCPTVTSTVVLAKPEGVAVDLLGALYIADSGNACIRKVAGVLTTVRRRNGSSRARVRVRSSYIERVPVDLRRGRAPDCRISLRRLRCLGADAGRQGRRHGAAQSSDWAGFRRVRRSVCGRHRE